MYSISRHSFMESDRTLGEESPKVLAAKEVMQILDQVVHKIDENDVFSAQVMVGVALHQLQNLHIDLKKHLDMEKMLRNTLKHS